VASYDPAAGGAQGAALPGLLAAAADDAADESALPGKTSRSPPKLVTLFAKMLEAIFSKPYSQPSP
jgi:hypothetical protein